MPAKPSSNMRPLNVDGRMCTDQGVFYKEHGRSTSRCRTEGGMKRQERRPAAFLFCWSRTS